MSAEMALSEAPAADLLAINTKSLAADLKPADNLRASEVNLLILFLVTERGLTFGLTTNAHLGCPRVLGE